MKTGDTFHSFQDLQIAMQTQWGITFPERGFIKGAFILNLPPNPNHPGEIVCCARHVFYNKNLKKEPLFPWNEFDKINKSTTLNNWDDTTWICSDATEFVHEIRNPNDQHLQKVLAGEPLHRLIVGQFNEAHYAKYIFLGLYELDQNKSNSYSANSPYMTDTNSFPGNLSFGPSIDYPHCVWKRIATNW
jgi:hypothetical protein